MPRGDGTGPAGFGPRTGRAAGYCAGYGMPGFANPGFGRGFFGRGGGRGAWGGGGGRGWRNRYYATGLPGWMRYGAYGFPASPPPDPEFEKRSLADEAEALQAELEAIRRRLSELETEAAEERK